MTGTTSAQREPRTYGGWLRPQTMGLPRLGFLGSVVLFGCGMFTLIIAMVGGLKPAGIWLLITAGVVLPLLYKDKAGRHGWQILGERLAWYDRKHRRETVWLPAKVEPIAFTNQSHPLPGILAKSRLLQAEDPYGTPFVMVKIPQANHYAVPFALEPDGVDLVDDTVVDTLVAKYGHWQASLAVEDNLVAAAVTVEVASDPGHILGANIGRISRPTMPDLSKKVLGEIADTYPRTSFDIRAFATLTYSSLRADMDERELSLQTDHRARRSIRSDGEMAANIGRRINPQIKMLMQTGAGHAHAMSADELCEQVRVAYDPKAAAAIQRCRANDTPTGITWDNVGPSSGDERRAFYWTGDAVHITWQLIQPPVGIVDERVLEAILAPHPLIARKRVTIFYRPHTPADAKTIADRDVRTAISRATERKGEKKATDTVTVEIARKAARENAQGAGLIRFSALVTATVEGIEDYGSEAARKVGVAAATVEQLGRESDLRLRRVYTAQAAAFQQALGVCGVIPQGHVSLPEPVRKLL